MMKLEPMTIVEHLVDGKPSETIYSKRLVLFIATGDKENEIGIVLPVRPVVAIPKNPGFGFFYTASDLDERTLRYGRAIEARVSRIRAGLDPRACEPLSYLPTTRYLEIDATIHEAVPVVFFGEKIKKLPENLGESILSYLNDRLEEKKYRTPAERIPLYLSEDEQSTAKLKYWTNRKKMVLQKLLLKFELKDIAEFFGTTPEKIQSIAQKFDLMKM